jgi:hypothetical protein
MTSAAADATGVGWGKQRLGRRGSTRFAVDDSSGGDLHVALESLGEGGRSVTARIYRPAFPDWLFVGLGVALTAVAALIDSWRPVELRIGGWAGPGYSTSFPDAPARAELPASPQGTGPARIGVPRSLHGDT